MDLHQKEIQGFFSFPVDNLRASPFLLQYIQEEVRSHRTHPVLPVVALVSDFHTERHARALSLSLDPEAARQGQHLGMEGHRVQRLSLDFLLSIFSNWLMCS